MKKSDPIPQWMSIHPQGVVVRFHVQPKASRSEICGCHGEGNDVRVKIRVAAPPADGAANEALIHFLKKLTGTPSSRLHLIRGEKSKLKDVLFQDAAAEHVIATLRTNR